MNRRYTAAALACATVFALVMIVPTVFWRLALVLAPDVDPWLRVVAEVLTGVWLGVTLLAGVVLTVSWLRR